MTYACLKVCAPVFGLINTSVLINYNILLNKRKQALRTHEIIFRVRKVMQYFFTKHFTSALFFIKDFFNILLRHKVLKLKVVRISLTAKCVLSYFKKSFNKYKFKRFLSGIDYFQINTPKQCI